MSRSSLHVTDGCRPATEVFLRIGDKWTLIVVARLWSKSRRFSELRREIPDISQRMLTVTLRELERVTVSHGLGDLHRRTLDFARHHACADAVVGLFGAVSTGKSSLVNSLLGDALLPVAALPTTAVPVEIRHGATTRGWVAFATEQPEAIDRARVAEFVDAHFNADNYRGVTRIALQSPSTLLAKGVT